MSGANYMCCCKCGKKIVYTGENDKPYGICCEACLEHLTAQLAAHKWIKVEERLPENTKRVMVLYRNQLKKRRVTIAEYVPYRTILAEDFLTDDCPDEFYSSEYDEKNDCYWTPQGWYESNYQADINWHIGEKITHWKPIILPEGE